MRRKSQKKNLGPKKEMIDILKELSYRTGVDIYVSLKNGEMKLLKNYLLKKDRILNL